MVDIERAVIYGLDRVVIFQGAYVFMLFTSRDIIVERCWQSLGWASVLEEALSVEPKWERQYYGSQLPHFFDQRSEALTNTRDHY